MANDDAYLSLDHVEFRYPGAQTSAIKDFNLSVRKGELLTLLGPSGCGKTTTLQIITGILKPTSGSVNVDGKNITDLPINRRNIGVVFQDYALFPHMNVGQNVSFGLEMQKVPKAERVRKVNDILHTVGLDGFEQRAVASLSGGQKQRVAIARALVARPKILLFDEPLSSLDASLRQELRTQMRRIQQDSGITSIFVTHDQQEAFAISDRVALLNKGVIEQIDVPDHIYSHPSTSFVARFIGGSNLVPVTVDGPIASDGTADVVCDQLGRIRGVLSESARTTTGEHVAVIHPHQLSISSDTASSAPQGTIVAREFHGETTMYTVQAGDLTLLVNRHDAFCDHLEIGATVTITPNEEKVWVIPA
ncbi:spermidine/putrescine ABC transporter ATP-binding protein [Bifidobacterium goeldii]|uniref:ABC-type quaternary amine transporter n=1 Tax=Bifidobacterium goeldii TaxID=2306975 RepID=A0A430FNG6_9BIFI|nr:ABC transporter ATP-binding protein [Bifidobacterium goeldii]RSX54359.1 spermidine/putrescine ABC transporter ATP-binding protein [Bifidobacterium goeldii]